MSAMHVVLDDWIAIVEDEYLRQFITRGGAAVKVAVVPSPVVGAALRADLRAIAGATGCRFAEVDAARTRIHMIDHVFHEIARQIDWDNLAVAFVRRLLAAEGYFIPDDPARDAGHALDDGAFTYRALAATNDTSEAELRRAVRMQLERHLFRDYAMAQEFRIAMMRLCQAQLEAEAIDRAERQAIGDWLRGELRLISALKRSLIFQKVARHNARDLLLSLAHWLRLAGTSGLVLALDIQRYLESHRALDGTLYHTPMAVLDMYEVLRQFIDATDELEGCLIVAIAPRAFLDDPKRGLERYPPLHTRISDEVQDRFRANPLASLVRLEPRTLARSPMGTAR